MSAEESREQERAALRNTLLPSAPVPDPVRPHISPRTPHDLLEVSRQRFYSNPTSVVAQQQFRAAEVLVAIVEHPHISLKNRRDLAHLIRQKQVPPLPEDPKKHPIPLALRRLREAKTEAGKARNEKLLEAAHIEVVIRRAREEGLSEEKREQLAEILLRGVTSSS